MATGIAGWAHTPFGKYDNESLIASSQGTGLGQQGTFASMQRASA
ncbi:hypothetical protein PQR57_21865 [Paraburkholderia dipogonis]|uniref:Uncharacterized protein n=1 Tax=Paraburkholderia dipogonis TaxID=1211383 RepID=A0ABW9AW51_9BURK